MARSRSHTRRSPRSNPRGVLDVRPGGFAFVRTAEGEYYVPESKTAGAFDGDLVELAPLPAQGKGGRRGGRGPHASGEKPAARVLRVVDRAHDTLVGRYEVAEPFGVVVPEDPRIPYDVFTMRADRPDIEDGTLVRVRISTFPSRTSAATGVVEEVLGRADDERALVDLVVARHKLETSFSEGALAEARAAALDVDAALAEGYRDLRGRFAFTIDPADARDFDDALSIERVSTGEIRGAAPRATISAGARFADGRGAAEACWRLGVHIADVSRYVPWNSSIDLDARRRATSVYLADRVIPMLPEELSGDLCSLLPGEDRLTMTADLYLDDEACLVGYELYPAVIRSAARFAYDEVQAMLDGRAGRGALSGASTAQPEERALVQESDAALGEGGGPADGDGLGDEADLEGADGFGDDVDLGEGAVRRLRLLARIAKKRAAAREAAGGLDFDTVEARVRLDSEDRPTGVELRRKTDATSLVEEAMILANETVAAHLRGAEFPAMYRVHEPPAAESLEALVPVFQEFPWFEGVDRAKLAAGDPRELQRILAASANRPESELVSSLVLRSMKRAVYRPACEQHYGLASKAYAHFTSPIRRYPDLVVHRMLKAQLGRRPEKFDQEVSALPWIAEHSSDMERVAEKAARESQEVKLVEYMEQFTGRSFSATVSGVATYGLYVRLDNTAEGLVPVRELGAEYFAFDPVRHRLTGQDTGTLYRLGQRVPVVLASADPRARHLDFRLARKR